MISLLITNLNHKRNRRSNLAVMKMNDYRDRRRSSIDKQEYQRQQQQKHDCPKRPQSDKLSPTTEHKIKVQDRVIGTGSHSKSEKNQEYKRAVDVLGPYDVVCGRGSVAFNNIGNRRFRILITMNIDRYNKTDGRNRKGEFIESLIRTFQHEIGIRFFKPKEGKLIPLTECQIRQKVGHALRDVLAFQESQNQQQKQQTKSQNQQQKQLTESESDTIQKTAVTGIGPTTVTTMSRAEDTLSSIQFRLNEMRRETDAVCFENSVLPTPLPPSSIASNRSQTTFRDQESTMTTTLANSTIPAAMGFSHTSNHLPVSENTKNQQPGLGIGSAIDQNKTTWQRFLWDYSSMYSGTISSSENSVSNSSSNNYVNNNNNNNNNNEMEDHWDIDNSHKNNSYINHQHIEDIGDPIPIDDPEEQNDDIIKMLKF